MMVKREVSLEGCMIDWGDGGYCADIGCHFKYRVRFLTALIQRYCLVVVSKKAGRLMPDESG